VTVKDFRIFPDAHTVAAGEVTLDVWNRGPTTHEFVIVRSHLPSGSLPIGSDGLSVDESAVEPIGELDEVPTNSDGYLTIDLAPGRYVLFCNLEGHYLAGMHTAIEVLPDA
jgi:uncharacterized cupredoxin-like copper-binding protein